MRSPGLSAAASRRLRHPNARATSGTQAIAPDRYQVESALASLCHHLAKSLIWALSSVFLQGDNVVVDTNSSESGRMTGARIFVAIGFLILGTSFIASTGVLIYEFASADWLTMALAHSHLFLFFPLLGILGLVAFYFPSVVFTHLYWTHLPGGKVRFPLGLLAIAALSSGVFWWLDTKPRHVWEVSPAALATDKGETVRCAGDGQICRRVPIPDALANLRLEAQSRLGLGPFGRNCNVDPLLDLPNDMQKMRWCFPAKAMLVGVACCQVQARFTEVIAGMQADASTRSLTGKLDVYFLPLKIFFVLVVIVIGGLLAVWRS